MNPTQLLTYFGRVSEAPDALRRLRRLTFELAIRGKLVAQDPEEEPASELLKCIQKEKARLVESGEIRKAKPLRLMEEDTAPFDIPAGWEWVRIRQVTSDRGQVIPDQNFTYIDVTSVDKEVGRIADTRIVSAFEAPSRARKVVKTGDVLYSCVRPYLLNIAVIERDIVPPPIASTAFAVLNGFGLVLPKYLWIALRSPLMIAGVEMKMRGQAYPAINDSDFALLPLPLPPLAEQHRIVTKVDELMALCDRLEAAQVERENRRDRLSAASLSRLNDSADADPPTFREFVRFHLDHLPRLTTRPDQIPQLRQTILNLAVRGQLIPQDSNDEPTRELLKQIRVERARLVKEGEAKGEKGQPANKDAAKPFGIPKTWQWVSLGDIAFGFRYGTSVKCSYEHKGEPVLRIPNVANGIIDVEDLKYAPLTEREAEDLRLQLGDILMVRSNGSLNLVGRSALVEAHAVGFCYAGYLIRVRTSVDHLNARYLLLALNTTHVRDQIEIPIRTTVGLKNVNATELSNITIPLPPLAEQYRIVAKVNELLALCDRLEEQLTAAQNESHRLLEAVLQQTLTPTLLEAS